MSPKPILIAGPTASGKSALALEIAERIGGLVINADALQVYEGWRILSARPSEADEARAAHALYGHVPMEVAYSVGAWLRDVAPLLSAAAPPIIVGGTGLYLSALTEGLAEIPEISVDIRAQGNAIRIEEGAGGFLTRLASVDPEILERVDQQNPLLPLGGCEAVMLDADRDWLAARIEQRFDRMVDAGALEEVAAQLARGIDWTQPSSRALGAQELCDFIEGRITLDGAKTSASIATRQFAKRQRTWFRSRMRQWTRIRVSSDTAIGAVATKIITITPPDYLANTRHGPGGA